VPAHPAAIDALRGAYRPLRRRERCPRLDSAANRDGLRSARRGASWRIARARKTKLRKDDAPRGRPRSLPIDSTRPTSSALVVLGDLSFEGSAFSRLRPRRAAGPSAPTSSSAPMPAVPRALRPMPLQTGASERRSHQTSSKIAQRSSRWRAGARSRSIRRLRSALTSLYRELLGASATGSRRRRGGLLYRLRRIGQAGRVPRFAFPPSPRPPISSPAPEPLAARSQALRGIPATGRTRQDEEPAARRRRRYERYALLLESGDLHEQAPGRPRAAKTYSPALKTAPRSHILTS